MTNTEPLIILTNSKPLDDLIKIEDKLRDDYEDFKTVYLDADKHKGEVNLVKFSYALAKFDFDLDILSNLIDQLHLSTNSKLRRINNC